MRITNGRYNSIVMNWDGITPPLKEGTPISAAGTIANNGSAVGIVPTAVIAQTPMPRSIYVLDAGDVDLAEVEALSGLKLTEAAKNSMYAIRFHKADGSIDRPDDRMPNIANSTATSVANLKGDVNAILAALKDAGLMAGDSWGTVAVAQNTSNAQPTAETKSNSGHATPTLADGVITIALDCTVAELEDADHGSSWGTHKWLGFAVDTDQSTIKGLVFTDDTGASATLGDADIAEATALGLSAGEFILYIKAEDPAYLAGAKTFTLSGQGMEPATFTMKITET